MAIKNGENVCDRCGARGVKLSFSGGLFSNQSVCGRCNDEINHQKEIKKQSKQNSSGSSSRTASNRSSGLDITFWSVIKWIFCPIWGGPYLVIKGLRHDNKFWLIAGIEFTIALLIFMILTSKIPDLTSSTERFHQLISSFFGVLFIANIIILILFYVKYNDEY